MNIQKSFILVTLLCVLVFVFIVSSGIGAMKISPLQVISIFFSKTGLPSLVPFESGQENVLWSIRLPRVILGVLVGAGLAISGASLQGLFRNPLADPTLIGISSGASLCA